MEEIIVMNDESLESLHAAKYAFHLACIYNKNIIVADLNRIHEPILSFSPESDPGDYPREFLEEKTSHDLLDRLGALTSCKDFQPGIKRLDISAFGEKDLIRYINARKVWMLVQGVSTGERLSVQRLNLQAVLNRVHCPFMLVPAVAEIRPFERLAYLADLRYAQIPILNFLSRMNSGTESIIVAHICAQGLPELDNSYAMDLFSRGLSRNISADNLFFSHLRERNFMACIDQAINGMQADLLVCINRHYHFEQLLAGNVGGSIPDIINVPLLVFPQ